MELSGQYYWTEEKTKLAGIEGRTREGLVRFVVWVKGSPIWQMSKPLSVREFKEKYPVEMTMEEMKAMEEKK